VPENKAQENFTDPDSRIMKHAGGAFDASYNGQTAVDDTAHIIVAAELINNASDVHELPTMLEAVKANLGEYPQQTLADAGYRSEAVLDGLADKTDLYVALGREGKDRVAINAANLPRTAAMADKMRSDPGRKTYRRRKHIAEPPNGWIKSILGFRQFSLRGLHRVQAEWKLVCMALNLRRMATLTTR
jgi:IS5 family transposase